MTLGIEIIYFINSDSTNLPTFGQPPPIDEGFDLDDIFEFPEFDTATVKTALNYIDIITVIYFAIEYIVRFSCSPSRTKFFIKPMNLVDFLAILPYVISFFLASLQDLHILSKAGKVSTTLIV